MMSLGSYSRSALDDDHIAIGHTKTSLQCRSFSLVFGMQEYIDSGFESKLGQDLARSVGAAIIDDDDLLFDGE